MKLSDTGEERNMARRSMRAYLHTERQTSS